MKTFNKIKKFSGYLDYNIEETVLKKHTRKRKHQDEKIGEIQNSFYDCYCLLPPFF